MSGELQQNMTAASIKAMHTKQRNEQFESMNPQQRMVEVCKEILLYATRPKQEGVVIKDGAYMNLAATGQAGTVDLQQLAANASCTICMLGAALFCKAKLFDHVSLIDLGIIDEPLSKESELEFTMQRTAVIKQLKDLGDPLMLNAMEVAFERAMTVAPVIDYRGFRLLAMTQAIQSPAIRAAVIALDVIQNNGVIGEDCCWASRYRSSAWSESASNHFFGKVFFSKKAYLESPYANDQILMFSENCINYGVISYCDRGFDKRYVDRQTQPERYAELCAIYNRQSDDYQYVDLEHRRYATKIAEIFVAGQGIQICEEYGHRVLGDGHKLKEIADDE